MIPLFSLVAVWPLLTQSLPSTDDGALHMLRLVQIDRCLRHGVLPLRWAPDMAHGYGYPFFNFYASLSSYIAELWHLAGLTVPQAVAAATVCAYWVSGWGAYLLGRDISGFAASDPVGAPRRHGRGEDQPEPASGHTGPTQVSRLAGLVAAVGYMYAPYQFIDSAYRGNLAETWALAILPWVLWTARRAVCVPRAAVPRPAGASHEGTRHAPARWARIVPLALCYAALIYTHNVYALISSPVLGLYMALLWWRDGQAHPERSFALGVRLSAAIGLGLALSAFFWLPAFGERGWTRFSTGLVDYRTFFLSLRELLALPPQLDLSRLNFYPPRSLSWGVIVLAASAVALIGVRVFGARPKTDDGRRAGRLPVRLPSFVLRQLAWETLFFLAVFVGAAFLTVRASDWAWRTVPLLGFALIPWRFLGIASLGGSLVAGAVPANLSGLGKPDRFEAIVAAASVVAIVLLVATAVPWTYAEPFPQRDAYSVANILSWEYTSGLIGTTAKNEFLPAWSGGLPPEPADPRLTEEGDAIAARLDVASLPEGARLVEADYRLMRAELVVESPEPFRALYKQFYFPGWRVTVDGHEAPQIATAPYGLLGFDVPAGRHTIVVRPTTTPLRLAGSLTSILALIAALALVLAARMSARKAKAARLAPSLGRPSVAHTDVGRPLSFIWLGFAVLALLLLLAKEAWIDRTENVFRARRFDPGVPGGGIRGMDAGTAINFGNAYTLYGVDLPRQPTPAGEPLRVDLYLAARQPPGARPSGTDTVRAYARLADEHGRLWSLPDNTAPEGHRPPPDTAIWPTDRYGHWALLVQTLPGTPPGVYEIRVGLFEPGTWAGLNVLDDGGRMMSLSARIGPVEIARPRQAPGIEELDLDQTIDEAAAPGLRLLGVQVEQTPQRAGDPLTLALYWRAEAGMEQDYRLALAVRSGDQRLPLGQDLSLGRADHPTSSWVKGEVVRSLHALRVPAAAEAGADAAYTVEAVVTGADGGPAGTAQTVATGELESIERLWSLPEGVRPLGADLGGQVTLLGYTAAEQDGAQRVTLYWQAQREIHASYKAFVQWIGAGQAVAQDDAIPGGWQRPTTGWLPGEVVADAHVLVLPAPWPPGEYTLIAGLYDESTLQRLPLFDASMRAIGDHVVLERRVVE